MTEKFIANKATLDKHEYWYYINMTDTIGIQKKQFDKIITIKKQEYLVFKDGEKIMIKMEGRFLIHTYYNLLDVSGIKVINQIRDMIDVVEKEHEEMFPAWKKLKNNRGLKTIEASLHLLDIMKRKISILKETNPEYTL